VLDHAVFQKISCFVFDVDGVFTDTNVLITESGELLRTMTVRDGQAVKYALAAGYRVAIFTKGSSRGVKLRLQGLGITDYYDQLQEKTATFDQYMADQGIPMTEVLYMGDDLPDLPLLRKVALPCAPYDATPEVLSAAAYISPLGGGRGCVRDVIEKVMRSQGRWPAG
jgi:3-deoxy-D-manno-octulosonate 8-phosphate phosphatase (KDO 8-P phosphatase)